MGSLSLSFAVSRVFSGMGAVCSFVGQTLKIADYRAILASQKPVAMIFAEPLHTKIAHNYFPTAGAFI